LTKILGYDNLIHVIIVNKISEKEHGMNNIAIAVSLTVLAGLATGIGGLIILKSKLNNTRFLSISLGFSAGIMLYLSFIDMFPSALSTLQNSYGEKKGFIITSLGFFLGFFVNAVIDRLIPEKDNPHEYHEYTEEEKKELAHLGDKGLYQTGIKSALAIALHNFPEGLATFVAAMHDPKLGLTIAIAIAIHNIPEGMTVAVPIYYSTGNKSKAIYYAFLSGLVEPLGGIIAYIFFKSLTSDTLFGIIFSIVSGIMVFISIDKLLPTAEKYGGHHNSIYGLCVGMLFMGFSIVLLF